MNGTNDSPLQSWGLVLAAGRSTRFGGAKLLAPFRGAPLIEPVLRVVQQGMREGVLAGGVAVVAADSDTLEQLLRGHGLLPVATAEPAAGLAHSLRTGLARLARLAGPGDAAVIFLGDQPGVRAAVVRDLVEAFRVDPSPVRRPVYRDQPDTPGHPVLVPRRYWDLAGALQGDSGFGSVLRKRGIPIRRLEVPGANPDINLPEDLAALENDTR